MKRFVLRLVIAIAILVAACSSCGPQWTHSNYTTVRAAGRITVCLSLPEEQLPAAHAAVERWDKVLKKWSRMEAIDRPKDDGICSIVVRQHEGPLIERDGNVKDRALAWCSCVGCREIEMRIGSYEQDVTGILEHEIGHALGAQHADGTLMDQYWNPSLYACPDRITVLQVAAWNRINMDLLSWCFY